MSRGRIPERSLALLGMAVLLVAGCEAPAPPDAERAANTHIASLADLSLAALRARSYGTVIHPEANLGESEAGPAYRSHFSRDGSPEYDTYVASYDSDGNRVYARIDVPAQAAPPGGYPVVIFVHGWYGREAAPGYDFMYQPDSLYSRYIDAMVDAGFLVVSPALRGHGTVDGVPAGGVEFLDAWDNATYLSPVFYAIDVLNLLEGLQTLETEDWGRYARTGPIRIDASRISIAGQSQGGDAVLTALAVSGEGSTVRNQLMAGSIWSGCFGPRLEQAALYGPMAATTEAFLAGDGNWTGSATGRDGSVNPNFLFGWPPDWIVTPDPASPEWTWQAETWSVPTVAEVLQDRHAQMYGRINDQVEDIGDASFELVTGADGRVSIRHDPRIDGAMQLIDAYRHDEFLSEPLHLHHSDQDYYSIPRWNADLANRINARGGHAVDYLYPRNTHSLLASPHHWFSPGEVVAGLFYMVPRDVALFRGDDPEQVGRQTDELLSIEALRRYAAALKNEFRPEYERAPLDGVQRRVVSFHGDGLRQYALVLEPAGAPPESGWPVLLMNHGHHPDPRNYGRVADGGTDRPGDYYRGIPLAFAQRGYLVVVPDFRGHNDSEGAGYARGSLESHWYARDTIAAFRALPSLPAADTSRVYLWGHSMGGAVTLRALLALGDEVRGASIWSSSSASLSDEAESDPAGFLGDLKTPLNIHHASGDPVTPYAWSAALHEELSGLGHRATLYPYPSSDHLFTGDDIQRAIDRDSLFFDQLAD